MNTESQQIVQEIVGKTHSELILFFVLVIVALVIVVMPLYSIVRKDRRERAKDDIDQRKLTLSVVSANTEVMAGLKTMLDVMNATMERSRSDTKESFQRIHERLDLTLKQLDEITASKKSQTTEVSQ